MVFHPCGFSSFLFRGLLQGSAALFLIASLEARAGEGSAISDLVVYQTATKQGQVYLTGKDIHIAFKLATARDVAVEVGHHKSDSATYPFGKWPENYLAEPPVVATLHLGHLEAGAHDTVWNGLDDQGQPVMEASLIPRDWLMDMIHRVPHPTAEQMIVKQPVDFFNFKVKAGEAEQSINYRRVNEGMGAFREPSMSGVIGMISDGKGNFLAANWQNERLTSVFQPDVFYPKLVVYNVDNACREEKQVVFDPRGYVAFGNTHSLYRYTVDDGKEAPWPATKSLKLGFSVNNVPEDQVKKTPGMAFEFHGWSMNRDGTLFVLRWIFDLGKTPDWGSGKKVLADVEVFDHDGNHQRFISLPKEAYLGVAPNLNLAQQLAADQNGNLWVGSIIAYLIDGKTGAIKGQFKHPTRQVTVGADGAVYGISFDGNDIYRMHADGSPFPFSATAPGVKDNGETLSLNSDGSPLLPSMRKVVPTTVTGMEKGDFYVLMTPGPSGQPFLHFAADGTFLPVGLTKVDLVSSRDANVFVDQQPATLDFTVNNPSPENRTVTIDWILTDFYGQKTSGKSEINVRPFARESHEITLSADEFGFYTFKGSVEGEGITCETALARVRGRDHGFKPDSPFALCNPSPNDYYLGALAGEKKERFGSYEWQDREPVPGLVLPDSPDLMTGFAVRRDYAGHNGILEDEMSNYAEPWTEGYYINQIHDLSLYLKDWMGVVDKVQGHYVNHYQFWNEPNNFWQTQGANPLDLFDTVDGDYWDINKARDKEISSIADGNASNYDLMARMGGDGTAIYNDAVECHYPAERIDHHFGAELGASEMGTGGFPEDGADDLKKLVAIRDQSFPGKPILDMEDSWYGDPSISLKAGADSIPRSYIPKMAAGLDEFYWFEMESTADGPCPTGLISLLHYPDVSPQPAFCSYASMTYLLEDAEYVGPVDLKTVAGSKKPSLAYLFRKGDQAVLAAWVMVGQEDLTLPLGVDQATIYDIMSRKMDVAASGGGIPVHLNDSPQYVVFPFKDWAKSMVKNELSRQLTALQVMEVTSLPQEMKTAAATALTSLPAMNRFYHLVKAARQAAFAGLWPAQVDAEEPGKQLRAAILAKEGDDGYLRQSRLPLNWIEQIGRRANAQGGEVKPALLSVANAIVEAAQPMVAAESIIYPGVAVNAYIGDPGEIEKVRAAPFVGPTYPFYEDKFRTEISKKAGDSFELELTAWNFYRHPMQGKLSPKLPEGWTAVAAHPADDFSLQPGQFVRVLYTVTIPVGAQAGTYPADGETTYQGVSRGGVMAQRVVVAPR